MKLFGKIRQRIWPWWYDGSDLSPFVRILEENKEMLAETIQWKNSEVQSN